MITREAYLYLLEQMGKRRREKKMDDPNERLTLVKVWDSNAKCPKCESSNDDLAIKWNPDGNGSNGASYELPNEDSGRPYEHLSMSCKKCGYEWLMDTADVAERDNDDEPEDEGAEIKVERNPVGHAKRIVHP